jgi:hypothetical protein
MAISVIRDSFSPQNQKTRQRSSAGGLRILVAADLSWDAKVRRRTRHGMMVVMTMMEANGHLPPP